MKIAIFGRITRNTDFNIIKDFLIFLKNEGINYYIYEEYANALNNHIAEGEALDLLSCTFTTYSEELKCDFFYSIGGDGTLLDSVRLVGKIGTPIVGINVGRLGFLANTNQHELKKITNLLLIGEWIPEYRDLIALEATPKIIFNEYNFAINEVTLHKSNSNEMIVVHTYIDGIFMNSYWADGLIVSTPTGSTAYSLACGGPIIVPQSNSWVITPIAPHSLTVRPIIVPTTCEITFEIESRSGQALVALDNRNELVQEHVRLLVKSADFKVVLATFAHNNFFETLRNRLNWGVDSRN